MFPTRLFSSLPRLYLNVILIRDNEINISDEHIHYIKNVLRLKINDMFKIFNEKNGEFIVKILTINKNHIIVKILDLLREKEKNNINITLGLSIIKMDKMILAISMATQLGVNNIVPIISSRSQFKIINETRINKVIIESTEQSNRITPPRLLPIIPLCKYRDTYSNDLILYANEHHNIKNQSNINNSKNITVIIGPEGGFTDEELEIMSSWSESISINLGEYILRSETAVATAISYAKFLLT
jgi:16S rRNA (uracil1498-N3)-methyltransferase